MKAKPKKKRNENYKKKIGQAPGSIIYTGKKASQNLFIEVFDYDIDQYEEKELSKIEDAFEYQNMDLVTWINVNGLNHVAEIEKIGKFFDIHPLVLEDVVNVAQRPKIDEYQDYIFVVLKMLRYDDNANIIFEQVSFVMGEQYVITFQEAEGDVFNTVRDRIRNAKGRIRGMKSDYLLYCLMDAVVDQYFVIIETLGDKIENLESELFSGKSNQTISQEIQELKREILKVRRAIFPLRDILGRIEKHENDFIDPKILTYYRDVNDHLIQVSENIDIYREMIMSLLDMYMSTISNKMNEVMKVLTIMASIFIPLTFIAGIYGMNFEHMPELHYKYGYFMVWGIFVILVIAMLIYFKRKKWI